MRPSITWIILSVLCSVSGHFALKVGALRLNLVDRSANLLTGVGINRWLFLGTALHGLALILWTIGLRRVELSVAYPFVALGLVLASLLSCLFLKEAMNPTRLVGMLLISSGVILIARS